MLGGLIAIVLTQAAPDAAAATTGPAPGWMSLPSAYEFSRHYPKEARTGRLEGVAAIKCHVDRDGRLDSCAVMEERPAGHGFGEAALRMAPSFRSEPLRRNGEPVDGGWAVVPVRFKLKP